ncbi:hypothetical protein D3C71_22400 [compost metagenome]
MKVVNLFAGPGTGKSTTGQILAGLLSIGGYRVELVPEFAKFATFANNQAALSDQIYMFGKQENRLHVLKSQGFDFVIMDGPLPIALLYTPQDYYRHYEPLVMEVFKSYDNFNVMLRANPALAYQQHGRTQSQPESALLSLKLEELLQGHGIPLEYELVRPQLPLVLYERLTGKKAPSLELLETA